MTIGREEKVAIFNDESWGKKNRKIRISTDRKILKILNWLVGRKIRHIAQGVKIMKFNHSETPQNYTNISGF